MGVKRVLILVIDGLGIGAMADVARERPQDIGADTLGNVVDKCGFPLRLPVLERLGLGNIRATAAAAPVASPLASWGRSKLAHYGADTFAGHQELMGSKPRRPVQQLMQDIGPGLAAHLQQAGFTVTFPFPGRQLLLINGRVAVHDNMEGEVAQNINVTGSLDELDFAEIEAVGQAVREYVRVNRVIVVAGRGFGTEDILAATVERPGQFGVSTPELGVYDENYMVRHLGYGVDLHRQLPTIAAQAGLAVALVGKAADVVFCDGAFKANDIRTKSVFARTVDLWQKQAAELIVANVQETDLAGHEQDALRYARLLEQVDQGVAELLDLMGPEDALIITADHGNDPLVGHGGHTREQVPLLMYRPGHKAFDLGLRQTLGDTAATAARLLGIENPENGTSFV